MYLFTKETPFIHEINALCGRFFLYIVKYFMFWIKIKDHRLQLSVLNCMVPSWLINKVYEAVALFAMIRQSKRRQFSIKKFIN